MNRQSFPIHNTGFLALSPVLEIPPTSVIRYKLGGNLQGGQNLARSADFVKFKNTQNYANMARTRPAGATVGTEL